MEPRVHGATHSASPFACLRRFEKAGIFNFRGLRLPDGTKKLGKDGVDLSYSGLYGFFSCKGVPSVFSKVCLPLDANTFAVDRTFDQKCPLSVSLRGRAYVRLKNILRSMKN